MTYIRSLFIMAGLAIAAASALAHDGHEHTAAATSSDKYPLTTCVVSGDKLGEMGDPVTYTYKQPGKPDRVVQFCCKDCIKDFEKDPAKYLAKLDAAIAGHADKVAATGANDKAGAMEGCCAAGEDSCCELLKAYVPISEALAADNLEAAKSAAATLAKQADNDGMKTIYQPALALVHANDLTAARNAFKQLSKEVAPLADKAKGYTVMTCPMAKADWVQTDTKVHNPYYGKMMLTCGGPKKMTE